ncbi:hypothetical protein DFP72DRAFT_500999 [Ephemerocybe angulata]|uniref:Secreted protein n=1 Tax=Ephemerocybe angulata TaxID=980116 RepID=A0A8H6HR53_9AGAR|nr:hypothetical protein DFP72DRAFT_500999 [Tulosesus angulatus]
MIPSLSQFAVGCLVVVVVSQSFRGRSQLHHAIRHSTEEDPVAESQANATLSWNACTYIRMSFSFLETVPAISHFNETGYRPSTNATYPLAPLDNI